MKNILFDLKREFVLWDYQVSHGQLLLRSEKRKGYSMNLDVIFFNTIHMQINTHISEMKIIIDNKFSNVGESENKIIYNSNNSKLFTIIDGETEFYIIASFFHIFENNLNPFETSLGISFSERGKLVGSYP